MAKTKSVDRPKKKFGKWGWVVVASVVGIAWLGAANPPEPDVPLTAEEQAQEEAAKLAAFYKGCTVDRYGTDAFVAMKLYVKQTLNNPGSARFSYKREQVRVDRSNCTFSLAGEFSAKNGFGGRVRGTYDVQLRRTQKGGWVPMSIRVN